MMAFSDLLDSKTAMLLEAEGQRHISVWRFNNSHFARILINNSFVTTDEIMITSNHQLFMSHSP